MKPLEKRILLDRLLTQKVRLRFRDARDDDVLASPSTILHLVENVRRPRTGFALEDSDFGSDREASILELPVL